MERIKDYLFKWVSIYHIVGPKAIRGIIIRAIKGLYSPLLKIISLGSNKIIKLSSEYIKGIKLYNPEEEDYKNVIKVIFHKK